MFVLEFSACRCFLYLKLDSPFCHSELFYLRILWHLQASNTLRKGKKLTIFDLTIGADWTATARDEGGVFLAGERRARKIVALDSSVPSPRDWRFGRSACVSQELLVDCNRITSVATSHASSVCAPQLYAQFDVLIIDRRRIMQDVSGGFLRAVCRFLGTFQFRAVLSGVLCCTEEPSSASAPKSASATCACPPTSSSCALQIFFPSSSSSPYFVASSSCAVPAFLKTHGDAWTFPSSRPRRWMTTKSPSLETGRCRLSRGSTQQQRKNYPST